MSDPDNTPAKVYGRKLKRKPRKRLPQLEWIQKGETSTGNPTWETRDGMLRLVHSTQCLGVSIPPKWVLFQYRGGMWRKVTESARGGRDPVEKRAREIAAEYDESDE